MVPNPAIRNLIREDKIHQIYGSMQSGQLKYGMQTFNQSLSELVLQGDITQTWPCPTRQTRRNCGT